MFISDHIAVDDIIIDKAWYYLIEYFNSKSIAEPIIDLVDMHIQNVIDVNVRANVRDNIESHVWAGNIESYYNLFLKANKYEKTKMNKQLSDAYKVAKSIFKK